MGKIKIIKARRDHIPVVVDMWKNFMDFHAAANPFYKRPPRAHIGYKKHLLKTFGSPNQQIFVVMVDGNIVGYAFVAIAKHPPSLIHRRYGYINDIHIEQGYRRHGLGRMMYTTVVDWFRQKGIDRIELGVVTKNKVAMSFWHKMGFTDRMMRMSLEI